MPPLLHALDRTVPSAPSSRESSSSLGAHAGHDPCPPSWRPHHSESRSFPCLLGRLLLPGCSSLGPHSPVPGLRTGSGAQCTLRTATRCPPESVLGVFLAPTLAPLAPPWRSLLVFQGLGHANHSNKLMFPWPLTHGRERQGPCQWLPPPGLPGSSPLPWEHSAVSLRSHQPPASRLPERRPQSLGSQCPGPPAGLFRPCDEA